MASQLDNRPRRWRAGWLTVVVLAGTALMPAASAGAAVPVVVVSGRGFGHGVGMAQDGALTMGVDGASTEQILGQFYPGTTIGRGRGQVRVPVLSTGAEEAVTLPGGGEVRSSLTAPQAPGFPVTVAPGATVILGGEGRVRAASFQRPQIFAGEAPETTSDTVPPLAPTPARPPPGQPPPPTTTSPSPPDAPVVPTPARPPATADAGPPGGASPGVGPPAAPPPMPAPAGSNLWVVPGPGHTVALGSTGARYRGVIESVTADGGLRLVNHLDVEDYLRGMGEVRDSRWPAASLQAQAVAARTYALRAMAAGGEICASQRCQVYLGAQAEYLAMDVAVAATRGKVLLHDGGLASAVYSANGGGVSATAAEGFGPGAGGAPYLRAQPYPSDDPDPWEVSVALPVLADRLGYPAGLRSVVVSETGPSGRATELELHGPAGTRAVSARRFAVALGLRSSLWSLEIADATTAPPAPPPGDLLQGLPEGHEVGSSDEVATAPVGPTERARGRGLDDPLATIATTPVSAAWWLSLGLFPVGVAMHRRAGRRQRTG